MKRQAFLIINCLSLLLGGSYLQGALLAPNKNQGPMSEGPRIRVLLEKNVYSALLEAKGEYAVLNKVTGAVLSTGSSGKRFVVHALQEGLRWGEEYPDVFQIVVVPRSPSTMIYVNGMQYKGAIAVYHCKDKQIALVNEVSLEDYLKSTMAVEIENQLSKEALAAIAIAQRTAAFSIVKEASSKKPWDVTAKESNYFGFSVTCRKNNVEEAVDWTRFMVLESANDGAPICLNISPSKAQELADKGFDAKKIIQTACPSAKFNVTEMPKPTVIR